MSDSLTSPQVIYKICRRSEWEAARLAGSYGGSRDDLRDGFIHFSLAHQLTGTATKYFAGQQELVLVAFDAQALGAALRMEASRDGQLFPHLYGPLDTDCALWVEALPWDGQAHEWPARL